MSFWRFANNLCINVLIATINNILWRITYSLSLNLSVFSCVHYSCEAIDCQEPLIRNAEVQCSDSGYFNGARCSVTCNSGYVLQIHRDDDIIKSQVCTNMGRQNEKDYVGSKAGRSPNKNHCAIRITGRTMQELIHSTSVLL